MANLKTTSITWFALAMGILCLATSTAATAACSDLYQQCGGAYYKGTTCCAAGSVCKVINKWYSQCLPAPHTGSCVALYGQCGGKAHTGPTCCDPGTVCVRHGEFYSQCLLETVPAPPADCSALYAQCGGRNWTGPKCCVSGTRCKFQNEYYSQCLAA